MIVKPYLILPLLAVSTLNIYFVHRKITIGKLLTKPFLMPLLILFYMQNAREPNYLVAAALICGLLGDIFLMLTNLRGYLLKGIGSFGLGHLFYIIAFLQKSDFLKGVPLWILAFLIPYLGIGILLGKRLFPYVKSMKLPVALYMIVIILMSFTSLTTMFRTSMFSFLTAFTGSLLFLVSDSLLAFDIFNVYKQRSQAYIMITYILAQLFITTGFIIP